MTSQGQAKWTAQMAEGFMVGCYAFLSSLGDLWERPVRVKPPVRDPSLTLGIPCKGDHTLRSHTRTGDLEPEGLPEVLAHCHTDQPRAQHHNNL